MIDVCPTDVGPTVLAEPTAEPIVGIRVEPFRYQSAGGTVIVTVDALLSPDVATRLEQEVRLIPE